MQEHPDGSGNSPFLVIDEKKVMLFRLFPLHKEAQDPSNPNSSSEVPNLSVEIELPLEKWIHWGCEVHSFEFRQGFTGWGWVCGALFDMEMMFT